MAFFNIFELLCHGTHRYWYMLSFIHWWGKHILVLVLKIKIKVNNLNLKNTATKIIQTYWKTVSTTQTLEKLHSIDTCLVYTNWCYNSVLLFSFVNGMSCMTMDDKQCSPSPIFCSGTYSTFQIIMNGVAH